MRGSGARATSALEKALDGAGGSGSQDSNLPNSRRNACQDGFEGRSRELPKRPSVHLSRNRSATASHSPCMARTQVPDRSLSDRRPPHMGDCTGARLFADQVRARLNIALLTTADQTSVDHGSWVLASELPLRARSGGGQNYVPTHPAYSRLLDPRWAEIALTRLRGVGEAGKTFKPLPTASQKHGGDNPEKPTARARNKSETTA